MTPLPCEPLLPSDSDAPPRYRHAAPSGPWPWMDFSCVDVTSSSIAVKTVTTVATDVATDEPEATTTVTDTSTATKWSGYPQNLFGNWTPEQVERSKMLEKCSKNRPSTIYWMDVGDDWKFTTPDMTGGSHISTVDIAYQEKFWKILQGKRPPNIRVRSLFVDDLTEPVLKMLGMKYNIEPFFFTSSINQIPSRYQEAISHEHGDHITITLPFVRTGRPGSGVSQPPQSTDNHINTQAPLPLSNGVVLLADFLAIHMVRNVESSTIISYHPESTSVSSAKHFHSLMLLVGHSVYWQNIFSKSKDSTFLFLAILWYPLYAWDESLESLHNHVSSLVPDILKSPAEHTCYLQALQGRLLHYELLLDGYHASVSFIEKTPNPAMESPSIFEAQRKTSNELMKKECENLLNEIDRLEKRRKTLKNRLKNLLDIANSHQTKVLIEAADKSSATLTTILESTNRLTDATVWDLAAMRQILESTNKLTDATVRDLAAMKEILDSTNKLTDATVKELAAMRQSSYLTMVFLLASFIASIYVKDIDGSGSLRTICDITLAVMIVYVVATLGMHDFTRKICRFWERGQLFFLRDAGENTSIIKQGARLGFA